MSSSLSMPRGMETINPSPEISRYYNKANAPYINTAQVLSEVLSPVRHPGQTFLVGNEEWWFKDGITDSDLIQKQLSSDNIDIVKTVVLVDGYSHSDLFAAVNNLTTFEVLGTESLWLEVLVVNAGTITQTRLYKFFYLGKGTYGEGGTQLQVDPSKCKLITVDGINPEENPTTQIVDEGWDITGTTISDYINNLATPITLQNTNSEGLVVIKVLNNGAAEEYLYNGNGGLFGLGEEQTVPSDFNKFNSSPGVYTNLKDGQELDLSYTGSNTFTLPENYLITSVYKDIALNKKATYVRSGVNEITILDTLEVGDVINIRGLVASGQFAPNTPLNLAQVTAEGSQTLVTIQSPDAVNANDLVNLGQVDALIEYSETNLQWIKSNESLSLAQRKGDVLHGILDQYTGEEITLSKITTTPTVDGIIYFQLGIEYFKRNVPASNPYNLKWYGVVADGVTDDSSAWNSIPNDGFYFLDGISIINSNVTKKITLQLSKNSKIKPNNLIEFRLSSGSKIIFDGSYFDNSLGGLLLIESGVISIGYNDRLTDTSGASYNNGYAGNFIDINSGVTYVNGGTNSFPHSVESGCQLSTIGGGYDNHILINSIASTISGGAHHYVRGSHGTVGGGAYQEANGSYSYLGGGQYNIVSSSFSVNGGGQQNIVGDPLAVDTLVHRAAFNGAGTQNEVFGLRAFNGAGLQNDVFGEGAVNVGGSTNKSNGLFSSNLGGINCWATGDYSTSLGGSNSRATANYAVAGGTSQATGVYSVAIGDFNLAQSPRSVAQGGRSAAYLDGMRALANGNFSTTGDRQISEFTASRQTTNAVPADLGLFGGAQPIVLRDGSTIAFEITVVSRNSLTTSENSAWKFRGLIKRDTGVATTAIVGVVDKSLIASDAAASTWGVNVSADIVNGALKIQVTGEAGKTIRWNSRIEFTELKV